MVMVGEAAEGDWWCTRSGIASVSGVRMVARDSGWVCGIRDGVVGGFVTGFV